nr:hypothetical protein [Alicycliphilus denitrificans]
MGASAAPASTTASGSSAASSRPCATSQPARLATASTASAGTASASACSAPERARAPLQRAHGLRGPRHARQPAALPAEGRQLALGLDALDHVGIEPAQRPRLPRALRRRAPGPPQRRGRQRGRERQPQQRQRRVQPRQRAQPRERHRHRAHQVAQHVGVEHLHQLGIGRGDGRQLAGAPAQHARGRGALQPVVDAELQSLDEREGQIVRGVRLPPAPQRRCRRRERQRHEARPQRRHSRPGNGLPGQPGSASQRRERRRLRQQAGQQGPGQARALRPHGHEQALQLLRQGEPHGLPSFACAASSRA